MKRNPQSESVLCTVRVDFFFLFIFDFWRWLINCFCLILDFIKNRCANKFGQRFKGFVDRLDSFHPGQVRVVDYKTGRVLEDDQNINDGNAEMIADKIFTKDEKERPKIALQFYMYDLLLKNRPECAGKQMFNCVYSTSSLFNEAPQTYPKNECFFKAVSQRLEA